jgi:hypothetical protein
MGTATGKILQGINSRRSAKRWTIAVITRMWEIAWDIWEYRNEVLHKENNYSTTEDAEAIDLRVKTLLDTIYIMGLLPKDLHLADITLTRLQFPKHQKKMVTSSITSLRSSEITTVSP